ncbi:R-spondin-3-like [Lethenteron reissneri]|uniref:R-spondin-3-like n=1 Tax=Lethenteron reissneri TaxID=7753 RepID=UPI002AB5EDD9|nr:R-spondin-3-like [Lethenteron reissneri]XP_061418617.1 R-spondin-3-like [Lethenteron reissneri]
MQLHVLLLLIVASLVDFTGGHNATARAKRHRRMGASSALCPRGCSGCSDANGCLSCMPRFFFHLQRAGMRQLGACLHMCPSGYYGLRATHMNKCAKCKIERCDTCFSKNFCTRCLPGSYLYKGNCYESCPDGFSPTNHTMECVPIVHCEVSMWGEWSQCTKNGRQCGFKWGRQWHARQVVRYPSSGGGLCPPLREVRKCRSQHRTCPDDDNSRHGRRGKKRKNKHRRPGAARGPQAARVRDKPAARQQRTELRTERTPAGAV